ncbi:MAG: AAA family ATPase [Phycisphaerae bacterium]|jgi:CO dehydrogenase maturation factor|nr:AAA family ATPase [Phycisphaerae bacterium]
MKIAVSGKGGVGKTTVCAIWSRLFAQDGHKVLAVDADPDSNLASALGLPEDKVPQPLINMEELIEERTGAKVDSVGQYFRLNPHVADLPDKFSVDVGGLRLLVVGAIERAGEGCACPQGAFLKALLSYTILRREEVLLVDLAAGLEFMGRASVQGIDALVTVVEPGSRSFSTAAAIARMGREMGIGLIAAIANKVADPTQVDIIREQLKPVPLLGYLPYSAAMQEADLKGLPVDQADAEIIERLREAKQRLEKLVASGIITEP